MTTRRRRADRPPVRRYEVTARDREILHAVARMGQATSDQVCRLFFPDPSTAARRLAKLTALRLLDVHVCSQIEPNIYTLGKNGVHVVVGHDGLELDDVHRARVGQQVDRHVRLLNDLRVELVLAARTCQKVQVVAFRSDLDLRRAGGSPPPAYIPDAVVALDLPRHEIVLMVEIDTGAESLSVFVGKVGVTIAVWQAGERCWGAAPGTWRPAVFVLSESRARALAQAIVKVGGGDLWLVAEVDRLRDVGAFGPIFAAARDVAATPRGARIAYSGALAPGANEVPR